MATVGESHYKGPDSPFKISKGKGYLSKVNLGLITGRSFQPDGNLFGIIGLQFVYVTLKTAVAERIALLSEQTPDLFGCHIRLIKPCAYLLFMQGYYFLYDTSNKGRRFGSLCHCCHYIFRNA